MESESAIAAMGALAQPTRLEAYGLIVKAGGDGLPVGELARLLDVRQNSMSTHLAILARAGIITPERRSRSIFYRANQDTLRTLVGFLTEFSGSE